MSFVRAWLALSAGIAVAAAGYGCGSKNGTGGNGGSGSSGTPGCLNANGGGATIATMGTGGDDNTVAPCAQCLAQKCSNEIAACDPDGGVDCYGIQACIDAVCFGLSMKGLMTEEGKCQVYCQGLHSDAMMAHLNYVNCAYSEQMVGDAGPPATCIATGFCAFYSYDYDRCVADQTAGPCKAAFDACNACGDCKQYVQCASNCSTWADCQKCFATPSGAAGMALYEAYQLCVDSPQVGSQGCFAQGWLPSF
jgi:hypothetical protein